MTLSHPYQNLEPFKVEKFDNFRLFFKIFWSVFFYRTPKLIENNAYNTPGILRMRTYESDRLGLIPFSLEGAQFG